MKNFKKLIKEAYLGNPLNEDRYLKNPDSYIKVTEPRFRKDKNNPNFLYGYINYDTGPGVSTALGKETMAGQIKRLSSMEAMRRMKAIAVQLEDAFDIEDIEVTDLENGQVNLFAVSDDFIDMDPKSELSTAMLEENDEETDYMRRRRGDYSGDMEDGMTDYERRRRETSDYMNEELKLGVKYELPTGEAGYIMTGGSKDPKDWKFSGNKESYLSVKDKLKPIKKQPGKFDGAYDMGMGKGHHIDEGTCGYGEDGVLGEEPAGPHLNEIESGDIVTYEGEDHTVQRIEDDDLGVRVYIRPNEKSYYGGRKDTFWVKPEDLKENMNDPVLVKTRAAQMKRDKIEADEKAKQADLDKKYGKSFMDKLEAEIVLKQQLGDLKSEREQIMIDMEQEAEPEGGKIADEYGSRLNDIDSRMELIQKDIDDLRMYESVNEESEGDKDTKVEKEEEEYTDYGSIKKLRGWDLKEVDESINEAKMSKERLEGLIWSLENEIKAWHPSSESKKKAMLDKLKKKLSKFESVNESYMGNKGDEVMITNTKKPDGDIPGNWVLEKPDGSAMVDMFFDSKEAAKKYAKDKELKLVPGFKEDIEEDFTHSSLAITDQSQISGLDDLELLDLLNRVSYEYTPELKNAARIIAQEIEDRNLTSKIHYVDNKRYEFKESVGVEEEIETSLTPNEIGDEAVERESNSAAYESLQESLRKKLKARLK